MSIKILQGSCLETLSSLEEKSVNTCVTSPPYWGLRDYGTGEWQGGDPDCNHVKSENKHGGQRSDRDQEGYKKLYNYKCLQCGAVRKDDQLGLEETPEKFVENLVNVFREVRRVLRDDGTVWLNLGDSYSSGGRKTTTNQSLRGDNEYGVTRPKPSDGIKEKDLVGIPWRVAFALQADGWYLRQDIIWHKPNPMPESVKDRCTKAHEYIFLLSKSPKYYYDNEAIKTKASDATEIRNKNKFNGAFKGQLKGSPNEKRWQEGRPIDEPKFSIDGKSNKRSVWTVTTKPYSEAHFATYPPELIKPCILAGCPEKVCSNCGEPYVRKLKEINIEPKIVNQNKTKTKKFESSMGGGGTSFKGHSGNFKKDGTPVTKPKKDLGLQKQCVCETNETKFGTVLDPFGGSGTTAQVSNNLNRNAILCELNPEYVEIAKGRLKHSLGMFLELEVVDKFPQPLDIKG